MKEPVITDEEHRMLYALQCSFSGSVGYSGMRQAAVAHRLAKRGLVLLVPKNITPEQEQRDKQRGKVLIPAGVVKKLPLINIGSA